MADKRGPKSDPRSKLDKMRDRDAIVRWKIRGYSDEDVVTKLNATGDRTYSVNLIMVRRDWATAIREWERQAAYNVGAARMREHQRLLELEQEFAEHYALHPISPAPGLSAQLEVIKARIALLGLNAPIQNKLEMDGEVEVKLSWGDLPPAKKPTVKVQTELKAEENLPATTG